MKRAELRFWLGLLSGMDAVCVFFSITLDHEVFRTPQNTLPNEQAYYDGGTQQKDIHDDMTAAVLHPIKWCSTSN